MSTQDNLQEAFAGESQANRKYLAFAKKADTEGYPQIAKLFRAAAAAETVHAHAHLRAMDGIGSTEENLKAAIAGEAHEYKSMYPEFLAEAEKEEASRAATSFRNALAVEEVHHDLYATALQSLEGGNDLPKTTVRVCETCGHTVYGDAPDRCPVCNATGERFFEVE